jgi:hypothetical protein
VDYELLQALIATESGFDAGRVAQRRGRPDAGHAATASRGLAWRPMPTGAPAGTEAGRPGREHPAGTRYLRYLLDLFPGRWTGPGRLQRRRGRGAAGGQPIPAFKETQNYVRTVHACYTTQLKPPAPALAASRGPGRVRMEQCSGRRLEPGQLPRPSRRGRPRQTRATPE